MSSNSAPGFRQYKGYEIKLCSIDARLEVHIVGKRVCVTSSALSVEETDHRPVIYVPREDTNSALLQVSESESYCPFKGY
ncbi:MAG: DUF427 domain-containing protein, partial [Pseudomonadota bacterium]